MVKKLDLLLITRGILALLVVLWHVEGYKGNLLPFINIPGRTAVIIFFGMSGYVISHGFIFEKYSFNKIDLKTFFQRRLIRVMPLFILISLVTLFHHYFFNKEWLLSFSQILPQLFMIQYNHEYLLNSVFWTLGIEMQFYLLAPLIIYFTIHYLKNTFSQLFFYFILFTVFLVMAYFKGPDCRNLFGNLFHFFSGIFSCYYIKEHGIPKVSNYFVGLIVIISISLSSYLYQNWALGYYSLGLFMINLCIPALIILHLNLSKVKLKEKFSLGSSFLTLGTISYGVYAWHPFAIKLMEEYNKYNLILILILTIVVAYISYNFFEKPILSYVTKQNQS